MILLAGLLAVLLAACAEATPDMSKIDYTPFVAPTLEPTKEPTATPVSPTPTPVPGLEVSSSTGCKDNLVYLSDVTIPDGTVVLTGSTLDKQWEVRNNGTCAWGEGYTMTLYDGNSLGTPDEQDMPVIGAGETGTIRMLLSAPETPGEYMSAWQASNPDGTPFGDPIFIDFVVQ